MTIFEEYTNSKREENKLEMDYSWAFHDYNENMCNISKAKNNLHTCGVALDKLDEIIKKRRKIEERIIEFSYLKDSEARYILPKLVKDMTFEDYEFKSLVIDNVRRALLVRRGTLLEEDITMDDLITNENVIILASTYHKDGFSLYQVMPDTKELGSELNGNLYNSDFGFIKNFIDGYIITKSERPEISLKDYYLLVRDSIKHGYDEDLLKYYDLDNAYKEDDRKAARRAKRRKDDYYHKKQRKSINKVQAQRKLAKLPSKYEPTEEDRAFNFVEKLEIELGRKFSSLEKENINSWLTVGFSEELVSLAYKEASARGNYNNSFIAEILRDFSRVNKVQEENSSLTIFEKIEFQRGKLLTPLEKDIINSWLMAGFSENIIFAALEEARLNGDLNINVITSILNELNNRGIKSRDDISRLNKDYITRAQQNKKLTK